MSLWPGREPELFLPIDYMYAMKYTRHLVADDLALANISRCVIHWRGYFISRVTHQQCFLSVGRTQAWRSLVSSILPNNNFSLVSICNCERIGCLPMPSIVQNTGVHVAVCSRKRNYGKFF